MTATPEELSLLRAVVAAAKTAMECDECRICKDDRARIHSALSALAVFEAREFGSAMSAALNGHFRPTPLSPAAAPRRNCSPACEHGVAWGSVCYGCGGTSMPRRPIDQLGDGEGYCDSTRCHHGLTNCAECHGGSSPEMPVYLPVPKRQYRDHEELLERARNVLSGAGCVQMDSCRPTLRDTSVVDELRELFREYEVADGKHD